MSRLARILIMLCLVIVVLPPITSLAQESQPTRSENFFIWRPAALSIEYPDTWISGSYAGNPFLVEGSDMAAVERAFNGEAPGVPAVMFLSHPVASRNLEVDEFLETFFPELDPTQAERFVFVGLNNSLRIQFNHEATGQTFEVITFKVLARSYAIVAAAPSENWDHFAATWQSIQDSIRVLDQRIAVRFLGDELNLQYPGNWAIASQGPVVALAEDDLPGGADPDTEEVMRIIEGDFDGAPPFIRAQFLDRASLGITGEGNEAATQLLTYYTGITDSPIQFFEWAEETPAASLLYEENGRRILALVVLDGESVLAAAISTPVERWEETLPRMLNVLIAFEFNDLPAVDNLTELLLNDEQRLFGYTTDKLEEL